MDGDNEFEIAFNQSKIDDLVSDLSYFHFNHRQFEIYLFVVDFFKKRLNISEIALRVVILDSLIETQKEGGVHFAFDEDYHPSLRFVVTDNILAAIKRNLIKLLLNKSDETKFDLLIDQFKQIYIERFALDSVSE